MSQSNYRVRRATLDDVGPLVDLWKSMHFGVEDLARRVTEFQVAENAEGKLAGAVGLQMSGRHGRIHSEGFVDFALADQLRPVLWDRLQAVAANHGLARFWTQEQAPFWSHCGLVKAEGEVMEKLPVPWRCGSSNWLTLKLKDDIDEVISADKEFAMFMEAEKQRTARALQQARVLKAVAVVIALAVLGLVMAAMFLLLRRNPHLLHR
jgi:N-acetylglutamate synthase-like GNAT family acetyltransferase